MAVLPARMLFTSLLLLSGLNPLGRDGALLRVRTANRLAAEAATAYAAGRDGVAIRAYEELGALTPLTEEARLDLGHAYFRAGHRGQARATYAPLTTSAVLPRRAVAFHQLGLLAAAERDYDRAQRLLRSALRADPNSPAIRASYESLTRWLAASPGDDDPPPGLGGPPRRQPRPNGSNEQPSESQPDGSNSAPQGMGDHAGGGDRPDAGGDRSQSVGQGRQPGGQRGFGDQPGASGEGPSARPTGGTDAADEATRRAQTVQAPQPDAAIPAAQARMLLEAMQAAETQYLQQLPRRPHPPIDPNRPDW